MTTDARLPSLEEMMNGSPFDIVDSPWGHIERWRASTLATGTMGALQSVYEAVRDDAAAQAARADASAARGALIKHLCEQVDALTSRCDAIASELGAIKAKERADAEAAAQEEEERQRALEEDPLEEPPGTAGEFLRASPSEPQADSSGDLPEELRTNVPPDPSTYPMSDPKELDLPPDPPEQPVAISLNEDD
jgi:hypothetical protein